MKREPDFHDCRRALEWLYDYLDGEIAASDEAYVKEHFKVCRSCLKRYHYEGDLLKRIREAAKKGKAPTALRKRVMMMCRGQQGK